MRYISYCPPFVISCGGRYNKAADPSPEKPASAIMRHCDATIPQLLGTTACSVSQLQHCDCVTDIEIRQCIEYTQSKCFIRVAN